VRKVLQDMIGYVDLLKIMKKITNDHQSMAILLELMPLIMADSSGVVTDEQYGEFKDVIHSVLDTYLYEANILKTANTYVTSSLHYTKFGAVLIALLLRVVLSGVCIAGC